MDNFRVIYRILRYLEKALDYDEPNMDCISAKALKLSDQRWVALMEMLSKEGYIDGFSAQRTVDGSILISSSTPRMRRGRVWVRLATGTTPAYGDALHMIVEGDEAGCFAKEGGIAIPGRFIGAASNGVAPVELYGVPAASGADGHAASTDDAKPTV